MIKFWLILANLDRGKKESISYYGSFQPLAVWRLWFLVSPLTMLDTDVTIRIVMESMDCLQIEHSSILESVNTTAQVCIMDFCCFDQERLPIDARFLSFPIQPSKNCFARALTCQKSLSVKLVKFKLKNYHEITYELSIALEIRL